MSNVTLVNASRSARPFLWTPDGLNTSNPYGSVSITTPLPSLGKYSEAIYNTVQAIVTSGAAGPVATVVIQGTDDALTAFGVTIPLILTNGSAAIAVPTTGYTLTVLDGNGAPTGQRTVATNTPVNMYTVPIDRTSAVWPSPFTQIDQGIVSLQVGMTAQGVTGIPLGTTLATITAGGLAGTLSAAFTGTTGTYLVNFANPYWAKTALATISLTGSTNTWDSDLVTFTTAAKYLRANVTALSGTSPVLQVWLGQ